MACCVINIHACTPIYIYIYNEREEDKSVSMQRCIAFSAAALDSLLQRPLMKCYSAAAKHADDFVYPYLYIYVIHLATGH